MLLAVLYLPYVLLSCVASRAIRSRGTVFLHVIAGGPDAAVGEDAPDDFVDPAWPDLFDRQIELRLAPRAARLPVNVATRSILYRRVSGVFPVLELCRHFLFVFRVTRRYRLALVHADQDVVAGCFGWSIARLRGAPFSYGVDEDWDECARFGRSWHAPARRLQRFFSRRLLRRADRVLISMPCLRDFAVRNGASDVLIRDVPIAVDPVPFESARPGAARAGETGAGVFRIAYVGRLAREKRVFDLVEVADGCRRRNFNVRFDVYGAGPDAADLARAVDERRLGAYVALHGPQPAREVPAIMAAADMLFLPAANRTCIEGALSGTPVLFFGDCHGHHFLEDGVSGFRVRRDDVAGALQVIQCLVGDPSLKRAVGRRAREAARRMLDDARIPVRRKEIFASLVAPLAPESAMARTA